MRPIVSKPGRYCPVHVLPLLVERYAIDVCSPGVNGHGVISGAVTSWHRLFVISSFAPAISTPVAGSRVIAGSFCLFCGNASPWSRSTFTLEPTLGAPPAAAGAASAATAATAARDLNLIRSSPLTCREPNRRTSIRRGLRLEPLGAE